MAEWILKSEPASYGWDDLVREGETEWTGVRNHAAAAHLRAMRAGDTGWFYHSMTDKALVGRVRIVREGQSEGEDGKWCSVRVAAAEPLARPVTLAEIKAEAALKDLPLVRQSRLSVSPVSPTEAKVLRRMAGG